MKRVGKRVLNIQNELYVSEFNHLSLCFRNLQSRYITINTIIS